MKFLRSIPDLPVNARLRLEKKGLTTPAKLMATTDEELLKMKLKFPQITGGYSTLSR